MDLPWWEYEMLLEGMCREGEDPEEVPREVGADTLAFDLGAHIRP